MISTDAARSGRASHRAALLPSILVALLAAGCLGPEPQATADEPEQGAAAATGDAPQPPPVAAEALGAEFPFESRYVEVEGSRIHYVEEGDGDPILFLHGNPTSSYLWRNVIPFVSPVGRAIAMDLIGFGDSDKPDLDYTAQDHYRFVEGFIEALELDELTLVLHDWGSVLGLEYARRHPERIRAVAFMEGIIPPTFPMDDLEAMGEAAGLFRQFRDPERGRELLMRQNLFIEQILANATVTRAMSEAEMARYRAPFEREADRYPIFVWPNELPIAGEPARNRRLVEGIGEWLMQSETPKLLLHARPGVLTPPQAARWMQEHYRNLEAVFVGYGSHYLQEDVPEAIGRNIALWLQRLEE